MKVIFLDIDGVLNSRKTLMQGVHLHPYHVLMIRSLCDQFEAKIVMSSTWRIGSDQRWHTTLECLRVTGLPQHYIIGKTPIFNGKCRGDEIKHWLDEHKEVEEYIIIDDDSDMLEEQMSRFIHTEYEHGLTVEKWQEACDLLASKTTID